MESIVPILIGLAGTVIGVILTKVTERFFDKKKKTKLFIADIDDVILWDWDGRKLLRHLIALDYETTDNLNEKNEGTPDQWAPIFMNNPDCWRLLALRKGELIGYWSFFALKDDFFQKVKRGLVSDSEISVDNVMPMDSPGTYNIYIVIMCIKEHYRKAGFKLLLNSFIDKLNELTASGRLINEVCANAFTNVGQITCKNFGLKEATPHHEFGIICTGTYDDIRKSRIVRKKLNANPVSVDA